MNNNHKVKDYYVSKAGPTQVQMCGLIIHFVRAGTKFAYLCFSSLESADPNYKGGNACKQKSHGVHKDFAH